MNNPSSNEMKHSPLPIIQRFIYSWASKGPFRQQIAKALYNKLRVTILVIIALYIPIDFGFIAITKFIKLYPISSQKNPLNNSFWIHLLDIKRCLAT